jgi:hypothetical protein
MLSIFGAGIIGAVILLIYWAARRGTGTVSFEVLSCRHYDGQWWVEVATGPTMGQWQVVGDGGTLALARATDLAGGRKRLGAHLPEDERPVSVRLVSAGSVVAEQKVA